jgi:hypothetical protein
MLFSNETDRRQSFFCEDGVVLLEYTIELPVPTSDCPLRDCLREIADRTEAYLTDNLAEMLRREYLASGERHKRFTFPRASYRLLCEACSPTLLVRDVSLMRGSRLLHAERTFWGCSERGLFSPP